MGKPTPPPWEVVISDTGFVSKLQTAYPIQDYYKNGKPKGVPHSWPIVAGLFAIDPDNAEFIVRAVNSHKALLAACRELLAYVEAERGWEGEEDAEPMVMRGRAAIAAALASPQAGTITKVAPPG